MDGWTPDSHLRHGGEEGADVVDGPVDFQPTVFDVGFEDLVSVEHGGVPRATFRKTPLVPPETEALGRVSLEDSQDDEGGGE